jgi:hypothetical protein
MEFSTEQQIVHQLMLRASYGKDVGLYHGKMGIILFFMHYYKHTNNPVYEDIADELMHELMQEMHMGMSIGFASGLSGIGWGIEYMMQNGLVEGCSLEICEDIDKKIMETDPLRITDYSIETGMEGLLHYVLAHIKGVMKQHSEFPFDEKYLNDLYTAIQNIPTESELSDNFRLLATQYSDFYKNKTELNYSLQLRNVIESDEIEIEKLSYSPLGLKKGLSGIMLKKYLQIVV